jgi:ribosomal protein S6--L-glutamate ligase
MRIGIILARDPPKPMNSIMSEVIRLLSEWGMAVSLIYPEAELSDLRQVQVQHDLYIFKEKTDLTLSLAGALHAAGAVILNPYPITVMIRDKIVTTRIFQTAGISVPETYVAFHPDQLLTFLNTGPLILKQPYRGSQGKGLRVIRHPDELKEVPINQGLLFAQRYHETQGHDHKIYCIGDQLFGVKRLWPAWSLEEKIGEPFTITPELRQIALRCGRVFGIELYSIDVIVCRGHPYVVDMSSFPGFIGVPSAALRLADYIYSAGQRVLNKELRLSVFEKEMVS